MQFLHIGIPQHVSLLAVLFVPFSPAGNLYNIPVAPHGSPLRAPVSPPGNLSNMLVASQSIPFSAPIFQPGSFSNTPVQVLITSKLHTTPDSLTNKPVSPHGSSSSIYSFLHRRVSNTPGGSLSNLAVSPGGSVSNMPASPDGCL